MRKILTFLELNTLFSLFCLLFFSVGGLALMLLSKADSFILLNQVHSILLDYIFSVCTFCGDGIFIIALCLLLFLLRQGKLALCILAGYLFSGLLVQVIKSLVYAPRPKVFFQASGLSFHLSNFATSRGGASSFPSGHTTSAFSIATVMAFSFVRKYWSIILFTGALIVGYSRIYLGHHFPADVMAGAFIGVASGMFTYWVVYHKVEWASLQKKVFTLLHWHRNNNRYTESPLP